MLPEVRLLAAVPALLIIASDLRSRRIPNVLPASLALLALADGFLRGTWPGITGCLIVFATGLILFRLGAVGGGDVKALSAAALLFPDRFPELLVLVSVLGGVVALVTLLRGWLSGRKPDGVPYGAAIGGGTLLCLLLPG